MLINKVRPGRMGKAELRIRQSCRMLNRNGMPVFHEKGVHVAIQAESHRVFRIVHLH